MQQSSPSLLSASAYLSTFSSTLTLNSCTGFHNILPTLHCLTRETSQAAERRPGQILERYDLAEDSIRQPDLEAGCRGLRPTNDDDDGISHSAVSPSLISLL